MSAYTMRDLLGAAFGIAREHSARVELLRVFGAMLDDRGRVLLASASFIARWEFAFRTGPGQGLTVSWLSDAYVGTPRPLVDPRPGNVDLAAPAIELAAYHEAELLVDSEEIARVVGPLGPRWTRSDGDFVVYSRQEGEDVIDVVAGGRIWRGRMEDLSLLFDTGAGA